MNTKKISAFVARKLQREYVRTRKEINQLLKRRISPIDLKVDIKEAMLKLTARQSRIIALYMLKAFKGGEKDAERELIGIIKAAAPPIEVVFSSTKDPNLARITRRNIGNIGKYNIALNKRLISQYDSLLSDNKLVSSLRQHGWTPWLGESLKKKGIDPKVISLIKNQTTSAKMLSILRDQGIQGGLHPNQVGRRLERYVNRYFGPTGVEIDNIGKTVKRIHVDVDGNFEWRNHIVSRKYKATTKTYSRLVAQNAMKQAHRDAYHESLQKTGLVDHYISISVMDARTCSICATLHGRRVLKGAGPQYHGNCHCDLKPVWKQDSLLGDKNKPEAFYAKQRDRHFLAAHDLKRFNETMPRGDKLKYYSMLPEGAKSGIMPGPLQMRATRYALMGKPAAIAPMAPSEIALMNNEAWQLHAKTVWANTSKDGLEHMNVYAADGSVRHFKGTQHGVDYVSPKTGTYSTMHSHPAEWDCALSDEDMIIFLRSPRELQSAAASKDTIYVITKKPGYSRLRTTLQEEEFEKEYRDLMKNYLSGIDTSKYSGMDYHSAVLHAGREMAKTHGIQYQVIPRRP